MPVIIFRSVWVVRFYRLVLAMFSALSNQSVIRDGVDYEEVYPSGHVDKESRRR